MLIEKELILTIEEFNGKSIVCDFSIPGDEIKVKAFIKEENKLNV